MSNILDFTGKSYHQRPDFTTSTILPEAELTFLSHIKNSPEEAKALLSLLRRQSF